MVKYFIILGHSNKNSRSIDKMLILFCVKWLLSVENARTLISLIRNVNKKKIENKIISHNWLQNAPVLECMESGRNVFRVFMSL